MNVSRFHRVALLNCVAMTALVAAQVASAQELQRGQTAAQHSKADYEAQGVRAGAFKVLPKVEVNETFNSNIYATSQNTKEDWISTVSPSVVVQSDFRNHALNFNAGADTNWYLFHGDENNTNYNIGANGRVDVLRDTKLTGGTTYKVAHEDRSSPDASSSDKEPTKYSVLGATLGGSHKLNRMAFGLDGAVNKYDFKDVNTNSGATSDKDGRDRTERKVTARVGYEIQSSYEAFLRTTFNERDYDQAKDGLNGLTGLNRDSSGYDIVVGTRLDLTKVLTGDVFAGYMSQDYSDIALKTISGLSAGLSLSWTPTQLTTIKPSVSRTVEETTDANYAGYIATAVRLDVEHELRRNVLINGGVRFSNNDYKAVTTFAGKAKEENTYGLSAGAKYLLNRYAFTGADYDFAMKDSNQASSDTRTHKGMLRIGFQY